MLMSNLLLRQGEGESRVLACLKLHLLSALSLTLLAVLSPTSSLPQATRMAGVRVVIVGAGVSGVAAANRLIRGGVTDVTLLEAQQRIGGRVHYKQLGNDYGGVDLGGHWIHGEEGNIVYELASGANLARHSGDYANQFLFRLDGSQLHLKVSLNHLFKTIFQAVEQAAENKTEITYQDLVNHHVVEFGESQNLSSDDVKALQLYISRILCVLEACEDISQVSVKTANEFQESSGDRLIEWSEGGMFNILELLMGSHEKSPWKGLGVQNKVLLNSRVSEINWSLTENITVTTESSSTLLADFVIFTPSLNVLKKNHNTIFKPPLPKKKVDAMEALEMDVVDKVYLVYREPWWPTNKSCNFIPLHNDAATSEFQDLSNAVVAFSTENHNPKVLGTWFTGKGAKKMETLSDEEVKSAIMKLLKQCIGNEYMITEPDMIIRSGWWNTQDVMGSYSFNSVKGDQFDNPRETLAQPLLIDGKPVVLFAGEATNQIHYSTVHGALETGWREAQRILDYLNK